jgi:hypothetical protein
MCRAALLLLVCLQDWQHADKFDPLTTTKQLPDMVQLGMNCSTHRTASHVLDQLQLFVAANPPNEGADFCALECFTPTTQRRLLVTATTRQHVTALRMMTTIPEIMQHVDAPTLHAVLKQLTEARFSSTIKTLLMADSLQETAVEQLTSEAVFELLQAATERDNGPSAELLCVLPAAKRLTAEALMQLLQAAVAAAAPLHGGSACVELLCRLPAASLLTSDALVQLLQAAVVAGKTKCMHQLCSLPAVRQLTAGNIAQLLHTAVQHSESAASGAVVLQVFNWPATRQLSADVVAQLSHAALQLLGQVASRRYKVGALDGVKLLRKLLDLPASRDMSSSVVVSLLTTAIQQEPQDFRSYHRTAQELASIVAKLCSLPAAQQFSVQVAEQLMQAGTQLEHSPCKTALHQLPAAQEMVRAREAALAAQMYGGLLGLGGKPAASG